MAKKKEKISKKRVSDSESWKVVTPPRSIPGEKVLHEDLGELLDISKKFLSEDAFKELKDQLTKKPVKSKKKSTKKSNKIRMPRGLGGEDTKYGGELSSYSIYSKVPVYNPDVIPIHVYDQMKRDPQISIGLAAIKLPILSLQWRIDSDNKDIAKFVEFALKRIWKKTVRSMLTAIDYGFASHEKVFKIEKVVLKSKNESGKEITHFDRDALILEKLKSHHPSSISALLDENDNFKGIIQTTGEGQAELDKKKSFFFTNEEEFGNIFGKSRMKSIYKFWYWTELIYSFALMYFEKRAITPTIVEYPPGETEKDGVRIDNSTLALKLGSAMTSNAIAAIPSTVQKDGKSKQWNIKYLEEDKRGEMFIDLINHLNVMKLRGLLVPERVLTQDSNTGSYSLAQTHMDVHIMEEEGLISDIEEAFNRDIIPTLIRFNFTPEESKDAYLRIDKMSYNRKMIIKEIFIETMSSLDTFVRQGFLPSVLPDIEEMAKIMEVPLKNIDEIVTKDASPDQNNKNNKASNNFDPNDFRRKGKKIQRGTKSGKFPRQPKDTRGRDTVKPK